LREKTILEKSKLTLKLIGMMLERRRICLKRSSIQYYPTPPAKTMIKANMTMNTNKTFDK
jgi:hypothetical protein